MAYSAKIQESGNLASRTIEGSNETFSYTGHQLTDANGSSLTYDGGRKWGQSPIFELRKNGQ